MGTSSIRIVQVFPSRLVGEKTHATLKVYRGIKDLDFCLNYVILILSNKQSPLTKLSSLGQFSIRVLGGGGGGGSRWGFNNRHLDLITYSSIYDAKTILDLYTDNINKTLRITYIPLCYLKSLKIKQKQ